MITTFETEQLLAWVRWFEDKYETFDLHEIAVAENVRLLFEQIQESYVWQTIENTNVLTINSAFSLTEQRRICFAALAADRMTKGEELLIVVSTN